MQAIEPAWVFSLVAQPALSLLPAPPLAQGVDEVAPAHVASASPAVIATIPLMASISNSRAPACLDDPQPGCRRE